MDKHIGAVTVTTGTFYIAGFIVATGAAFYVFNHEGRAGQNAKPCLIADRAEALKLANQAAQAYPLHAVAFVVKATV